MTSAYNQGEIPQFEMRHRLARAREYAGYSREELAAAIEVSRNTVLNAETGRTTPRKIMLNAWALACGVPVTWILTGNPPEGQPDPSSGLGIISGTQQRPLRQTTVLTFPDRRRKTEVTELAKSA